MSEREIRQLYLVDPNDIPPEEYDQITQFRRQGRDRRQRQPKRRRVK